jgi:hypothetical protein
VQMRDDAIKYVWTFVCFTSEPIGWLQSSWPPAYLGILQWLNNVLSLHESLECILSFLISTIITVHVSADRHTFDFFQCLQKEIEMCAVIF